MNNTAVAVSKFLNAPNALIGTTLLALLSVLPASGQAQQAGGSQSAAGQAGFPALIEPVRRANVVGTVESSVKEIHFAAGQTIEMGDLVVSLDDRHYQLAVKNAEANYRRAEKVLEAARGEFARTQKLHEKGSASSVQMLKSQVSVSLAEAVLDEALATLETQQTNLDRTVIRAPISGIIGRPLVEVGGLVSPGITPPLAQITQMDPIMIAYQVPYVERLQQLDIKHLNDFEQLLSQVNLTVVITDSWVYEHTAQPKHGSASVDPGTGALTIWAETPNPKHLLRPGMRVRVFPNVGPDGLKQAEHSQD